MINFKIRNFLESISLAILISVSLIFDYICNTKTFSYPDYKIISVTSVILSGWLWNLVIALAISLVTIFIIKMSAQKKFMLAMATLISLIVIILVTAYFFINNFNYRFYIYTFQRIVISSYMLICYALTSLLKEKMLKKYATIAYTLIHLLMIFFCSWNWLYKRFYYNPTVIIWLSTGFIVVYLKVLNDKVMSASQKIIVFTVSIFLQLFVFSFCRMAKIFNNLSFWSVYHENILKAFLKNEYLSLNLDPPTLYGLRDTPMMWLRLAFGKTHQIIYILVFILFLICLIRLYLKHEDKFTKFLITAILLSNFFALFCNINLFYSLELGIMTTGNPFQLITLICLLLMLREGEN